MLTEKTKNKVVFLGIFVLLFGPVPAQSAPPTEESGRLPSGKAYRVDENRFQITDHLA